MSSFAALIEERIALGQQLFHDPRLSADNSIACASCHQTEAALSDNRTKSIGIRERNLRTPIISDAAISTHQSMAEQSFFEGPQKNSRTPIV